MTKRDPQVHIRIPQLVKDTIEANAKANCRSLNSEIVFGLKFYAQALGQTKKASGADQSNPDASE